MARRKKTKDDELDAWIDQNPTHKSATCPLCEPKTKKELDSIEKRLRTRKKRVSMRAVWRRLTELKLIGFRHNSMGTKLQCPKHLKLYKYLKGLE